MTLDTQPFIREQHPVSRRYAVFEDDGTSGWLYLTAPDEHRLVADAWVYNRVAPPENVKSTRPRPPPLIARFAAEGAVVTEPTRSVWRFRWSADGEAVALERDGTLVALIARGRKRGYSLHISAECSWGSPLTTEVIAAAGVK